MAQVSRQDETAFAFRARCIPSCCSSARLRQNLVYPVIPNPWLIIKPPPSRERLRPRDLSLERSLPSPQAKRPGGRIPPGHHVIETGLPVTAFVCAVVPGTTRWHAHATLTASPKLRPGFRPVLLAALSSECGFSSTGSKGRHRIPFRRPHSLRGYSCSSSQQSRWEDASGVRLFRHVIRLPPEHRLQRVFVAPISGDRIQKLLPYPP